jgi:DNA invertase Pin-like site-specific DNA recombinase
MKIIAYSYSDPLLESVPLVSSWEKEINQIYQDLGGRQQLQQLLKDCQVSPPDYLLIKQLEQLGDTVQKVCEVLSQIEALGIKLIIEGKDPNTQQSTATDLLKLLNEIQQNYHSRSIRKGHARNRLKTLPPPGKAPYGYRRGKDRYILDRSAAPAVKDFFEHFLLYGSLRGAVRYLAKKHGKKISVSTGHRWLVNPVYRGDLAYQNNQVISNTHIPIISRAESAQIERLLRRNKKLAPRTASAPRSLAGLVVCQECESPMTVAKVTSRRKTKEYLYLRPINCHRHPHCQAISYQQILSQTIELICWELPRAVAKLTMPDMDGIKGKIEKEVAAKQEIIEQLPMLIETGILDSETAELRSYKLRTEISELQSQIAQLPPVNLRSIAQAVSLPQFWLDLSESERRFYFREFISQIKIIRQDTSWQIQLVFIF